VTSGFETPIDIGAKNGRINLHNQRAVFEVFAGANVVELANDRVRLTGTTNFEDNWAEPKRPWTNEHTDRNGLGCSRDRLRRCLLSLKTNLLQGVE
jgi:hypothetical protein